MLVVRILFSCPSITHELLKYRAKCCSLMFRVTHHEATSLSSGIQNTTLAIQSSTSSLLINCIHKGRNNKERSFTLQCLLLLVSHQPTNHWNTNTRAEHYLLYTLSTYILFSRFAIPSNCNKECKVNRTTHTDRSESLKNVRTESTEMYLVSRLFSSFSWCNRGHNHCLTYSLNINSDT